jgi:large subunit ribosomal protein L10
MKVVKNTLLKRAIADLGMKDLEPLFAEQIAVVFASSDAPAIAKILFEIADKDKVLTIRGGALEARYMDAAQVEMLAKLPSKEVLLAQLCATLNAPITNYVRLLNELIARFLRVLKAIEATKQ